MLFVCQSYVFVSTCFSKKASMFRFVILLVIYYFLALWDSYEFQLFFLLCLCWILQILNIEFIEKIRFSLIGFMMWIEPIRWHQLIFLLSLLLNILNKDLDFWRTYTAYGGVTLPQILSYMFHRLLLESDHFKQSLSIYLNWMKPFFVVFHRKLCMIVKNVFIVT